MESELKPKRIPRIVKPKKAEGEYETKIYIRRAVKAYEERMMNDFPENMNSDYRNKEIVMQNEKRLSN